MAPTITSPIPAGNAHNAGIWPFAISIRKTTPTSRHRLSKIRCRWLVRRPRNDGEKTRHSDKTVSARPSAIPTGGGLDTSWGRKKPRTASVAVTTAQPASSAALTRAVRDWWGEVRACHKTRAIATTTAAVNDTITTPRENIDMIKPHFRVRGDASSGENLSWCIPPIEMTDIILQAKTKYATVGRPLNRTSLPRPELPDDPARP